MRQKKIRHKRSFGKKTSISKLLLLQPVAMAEGHFMRVRFRLLMDPSAIKTRLFAVQKTGDLRDVRLAGPEPVETEPFSNDAA